MIRDTETTPVFCEEKTALYGCFFYLTNTNNWEISFPPPKISCGKDQNSVLFGILQWVVSCSQTQPKVVTLVGPHYLNLVIKDQNFQNGNQAVPSKLRVGHFIRLQQCLHLHTRWKLWALPYGFWLIHGSNGIHHSGQRDEAHGSDKEHKDPPLPGWPVDKGARQSYLDTQAHLALCKGIRQIFNI